MYCIIKTQSIILAVGCSNTFWQFAAAQLARRGSGSWLLLHNNGLEAALAVGYCTTGSSSNAYCKCLISNSNHSTN